MGLGLTAILRMRYSKPVLSCKTSSSLAPQVWKREALIERRKKPSRSELGPVGKKRRRELERGRRRKERRLWVWVWRKGGGGFGRDGEVKRRERVLGLGLKKRGPNMGFESESESVRRSGGLKTDDIGKRDFQSGESSIFHSFTRSMFNVHLPLSSTKLPKKKKQKKKKLYHSDCGFGGKAAVANRYIQIRIFFFFFFLICIQFLKTKANLFPLVFFFSFILQTLPILFFICQF